MHYGFLHRLGGFAAIVLMPLVADASVQGRFVRVEAPASSNMGIHEIEIWSGGKNVVLQNKDLVFAGVSYRGRDINVRKEGTRLIDGIADFAQRSAEFSTAGSLNPWVELDLGADRPLDRVVLNSTVKPIHADRAIRLVSVLDARRRVVWAKSFDIRQPPFDKGAAEFDLAAEPGPLVDGVVPPGSAQWVSLGELLPVHDADMPPDAVAREASFADRDSPAALARLAEAFFARMDLTKPELAAIKAKLDRGEAAAALDAYRDHFLAKLRAMEFKDTETDPSVPVTYDAAADDLVRGVAVAFTEHHATAQRVSAGQIDWAAVPAVENGGISAARARAMVGHLPMPLLSAFRLTGRPEYARQWAAMVDDWGLNIRADLDRASSAGADLRHYFVFDIQQFNDFADMLAETAKDRPDITSHVSGATLARLLIPVLEEYPAAYWWVCRRASFNHTYNALIAATISSRILDDFHAGHRLDDENRRHWQRIWTNCMTRDGSMNEISDEGHMFMQWRMAPAFDRMKQKPPWWFTQDFASEFETGWKQTATYPLRHLAPDGYGHRYGARNYAYFDRLWWLNDPTVACLELPASTKRVNTDIVDQPEYARVMQAVFGAAHERARLASSRQEAWDRVTGYYGTTFTPPTHTSDWMPYAGLWDLRRSWERDAGYVHMVCQPTGHPSTNGSVWNTEVHYFDHGQPVVALGPVWIDGNPPFNEAGTRTYKPGSKTETLAVASEFPIDSRWHSSSLCDYAECSSEGVYQRHAAKYEEKLGRNTLAFGDSPVEAARAARRVILFRPARLVVVTDAVHAPDNGKERLYEIRQRFATPEKAGRDDVPPRGTFAGDAAHLRYDNERMPGVTVRRFTTAALEWDKRSTPDGWESGASMSTHVGVIEHLGGILRARTRGNLLMSALIEPHRTAEEQTVRSVVDLSGEGRTGFSATLEDGTILTWLAGGGEPCTLTAGPLELDGEALLLHQRGDEAVGLILGGKNLRVAGKETVLAAADQEFTVLGSKFKAGAPIHRPISPVTFSPQETVFTQEQHVTLASATPGMEIRYTLDGSEPNLSSALYCEPLRIAKDSYIRARAVRPGAKELPFTTDGTLVTAISDARYFRRELEPAVPDPGPLQPGLRWELVEGSWRALFSHLDQPAVMPAQATGETAELLDVSMRQADGPFGIRYLGWIDIPADGVWTFHAPAEFVGASCEPGYDLRVWIDGKEWDPGQRWHGRGLWSVPLAKGPHRLQVAFADARHRDRTVHQAGLWRGYPSPWVVWDGAAPVIEISGPRVEKQPVPAAWLRH